MLLVIGVSVVDIVSFDDEKVVLVASVVCFVVDLDTSLVVDVLDVSVKDKVDDIVFLVVGFVFSNVDMSLAVCVTFVNAVFVDGE